jgi:lipopolysaccharide transport system ATP-binding protein
LRGECLGLIGRNGAGKTTLLKMLNGLIKPDHGRIEMRGRVGALIALGAGFNPILTGRENIYVNGSVLGLSKREIDAKIEDIIDFADIREFIDSPVQSYSSGMQVRLGFAVATAMEPDVLILDEVLAVGDAGFRQKCYNRISQIKKSACIIFVSHDMTQVGRICDRAILMASGKVSTFGGANVVITAYEQANSEKEQKLGDINKCSDIDCASLSLLVDNVLCDGYLTVILQIEPLLKVHNAIIYFTIFRNSGEISAQTSVVLNPKKIDTNETDPILYLKIGPLYLLGGTYTVSVVVVEPVSNYHIIWAERALKFSIQGDAFGPVAYRPNCSLEIKHK